MKERFRKFYIKQMFQPTPLCGAIFNQSYFIRSHLFNCVTETASIFKGGKLVDVGCGSKPYVGCFDVNEYIGLDIGNAKSYRDIDSVNYFYDGNQFPFPSAYCEWVFSTEVLEHVFNPDQFVSEIHRILKLGGKVALTTPFAWHEHEQPYDFCRYSSYGLIALLERNNFKVIKYEKKSHYLETICQLLIQYLHKKLCFGPPYVRLLMQMLFIAPFTLFSCIISNLASKNRDLYLTNFIIAVKE